MNVPWISFLLNGKLAGSAGNNLIRDCAKMRHRAEFGISIKKEYWGLGIGDALTKACIECAKNAGFLQLELEVVSENESAINLYKKHGFVEYGRNSRGFRCRDGRWQELVLMRLELDENDRKI
jgi:RimJ/RimL family protein N-acetyltransferase